MSGHDSQSAPSSFGCLGPDIGEAIGEAIGVDITLVFPRLYITNPHSATPETIASGTKDGAHDVREER